MDNKLTGSNLAQKIMSSKDQQLWCAVSNYSEEHAMSIIESKRYDLLTYIVSLKENYFVCQEGNMWQYAVPVKKVRLAQHETGL